MGFFSAVKKFFSPQEEPRPDAPQESAPEEKLPPETGIPEPEAPAEQPPKAISSHQEAGEAGAKSEAEEVAPDDHQNEPAEACAEKIKSEAPAEAVETVIEPGLSGKPSPGIPEIGQEPKLPEMIMDREPEIPETAPDLEPKLPETENSSWDDIQAALSGAQAEISTIEIAKPVEEARQDETSPGMEEKTGAIQTGATADDALLLKLREAEPKLSAWLDIILEGQEEADAEFWSRLKFLLTSLEAPPAEVDAFAADFQRWLKRMEYRYIDEFRSELQYRLALALDLEDEEDERNRLMLKLSQGLAATREQLGRKLDNLFASHGELDAAFWEEMEELFIMSDMGYESSLEIVERLKKRAAQGHVTEAAAGRQLLQDELEEIFKFQPRIRQANKPEVILMMGVNGAGKTTTIAKLAHRARMNGKKVLVAAADTFRAAAIEQLQVWAERSGADFYAKPSGSDPAAVAWEAMDYALKNDIDVVFVDTAGRLQTRVNLMEELGKIRQVLGKKHPGAPHRSMLVLDATTGQNALSQAKLFKEAAGADEIALTKLDGTAKGGVAIAVALKEGLPITYIGLGEKMEDLRPFNGRDFAKALLEGKAT